MSSIDQDAAAGTSGDVRKSAWVKPVFEQIEAGEAEGSDGTGTDASGMLS